MVENEIQADSNAQDGRDPLWYRVKYLRAALQVNYLARTSASGVPDPNSPELISAEEIATELVQRM